MARVNSILFTLLICIVSTSSLFATDIKHRGLIKLRQFFPTEHQQFFTMGFSNNAWLDAPVQGNVTVKDPMGQTVFEESLQTTGDVPAYTESTLTTQTPFIAELPGIYTIQSYVQPVGMGDIDESNNSWEGTIEIVSPPGLVLFPNQGLNIFQIDINFEGAAQENSSYGMAYLDWGTIYELAGFTLGYLNIVTAANWIIQNMIYDFTSGYPGLSGMFNLGVEDGTDVTELDLLAVLSEEPLLNIDLTPVATFEVGTRPYRAEGVGMPVGNIPTPIPFERLPFTEGGKSHLVWQHGHVSVEQDDSQCAPGAVSNSLQWLENKQGVNIPDDHKPGIRDNTLIGKLDTAMGRQTHNGVVPINTLNGKLKYLSSSGVKDHLKVKHKNIKGGTILPDSNYTVAGATSFVNNDTTVSLIDWVLAELDSNENVEMRIQWDGGGGHIIDLIGGGYVDGVPWIAWTHDANQGSTNNGTPDNTADDKVAMNGGISADSGGVGWSYLVNNKLKCFIAGKSYLGTISYGISESKKDPPTSVETKEIPKRFTLSQNYPNPFNPSTTIRYTIPKAAHVKLIVYDLLGKQVAVLVDNEQSAGTYDVMFNTNIQETNKQTLASGFYIYELRAGRFFDSKKMIYLK